MYLFLRKPLFHFSSIILNPSKFSELPILPELKSSLEKNKMINLTPIQQKSYLDLLNHKNCILLSETGFIILLIYHKEFDEIKKKN
jgi:hypothetical protein